MYAVLITNGEGEYLFFMNLCHYTHSHLQTSLSKKPREGYLKNLSQESKNAWR